MEERHRAGLRRRLTRLGEFYGYDIDEPAPIATLASTGLVMPGTEFEARIDAFPDLDVHRQRGVAVADRFYDPRHVKVRTVEAMAALEAKPLPGGALRVLLDVWRRVPDPVKSVLRPVVGRLRKWLI
jgi:hypothetical protein